MRRGERTLRGDHTRAPNIGLAAPVLVRSLSSLAPCARCSLRSLLPALAAVCLLPALAALTSPLFEPP